MGKKKKSSQQRLQVSSSISIQPPAIWYCSTKGTSDRPTLEANPTANADSGRCRSPTKLELAGMPESRGELMLGIGRLFNSPDHADIKIHINDYELPAHSVVLAAQSEFFDTALKRNFIKSNTMEFHFTGGSVHAYWRVFEYMYTGQYSEIITDLCDVQAYDDELIKDVRVYTLAGFFLMEDLKDFAIKRLDTSFKELWISEGFIDCITEIYGSTNENHRNLRDLVARKAHSGLEKLWAKKQFRELVRTCGDFAVDLTAFSLETEL